MDSMGLLPVDTVGKPRPDAINGVATGWGASSQEKQPM